MSRVWRVATYHVPVVRDWHHIARAWRFGGWVLAGVLSMGAVLDAIANSATGCVANAIWMQSGSVKPMPASRPEVFRGQHFRDEIIVHCVRWYLRYPVSHRISRK